MLEHYYINKHGIYFTRSCYGDDVEAVYLVEFDEDPRELQKQLERFVKQVRKEGAEEQMQNLRREFKTLRELL